MRMIPLVRWSLRLSEKQVASLRHPTSGAPCSNCNDARMQDASSFQLRPSACDLHCISSAGECTCRRLPQVLICEKAVRVLVLCSSNRPAQPLLWSSPSIGFRSAALVSNYTPAAAVVHQYANSVRACRWADRRLLGSAAQQMRSSIQALHVPIP